MQGWRGYLSRALSRLWENHTQWTRVSIVSGIEKRYFKAISPKTIRGCLIWLFRDNPREAACWWLGTGLHLFWNNYIVGLKIFAAFTGDSLFFGRKIIRTVAIFKWFCKRQKIIWVKETLLETKKGGATKYWQHFEKVDISRNDLLSGLLHG